MGVYLITFRSVTPAQRAEVLLRQMGIRCSLQRTPSVLAEQGCGYSIRLHRAQAAQAIELLRQKGIAYRKVYALGENGPEEVVL